MKNGDPERWLHDPKGAPPGAVQLLRAAPRPARPPAELRARLGSELETLAAVVRPHPFVWPFTTGAAVVALGVAGWLGLSRMHAPPPAPPPAPVARAEPTPQASAVARPPAPAESARAAALAADPVPAVSPPVLPNDRPRPSAPPARAPAPRHAPAHPAGRAEPPAAAPATPEADSLAREATLIEEARRTVRANPAAALRTLERHRREFAAGQLTAEREFLAVLALVQLGRHDEAGVRGRRLIQQYPGSAYAQQVPALLARGGGASQ